MRVIKIKMNKYLFNLIALFAALMALAAMLFLTACASSGVTRDAASDVDVSLEKAKGLVTDMRNSDISDSYQNSSQLAKGAALGGAAGLVTGALSSSVGIIPGTATGIILGASYGAWVDARASLADKLENRGANVVVLGDQILVVMPSARLFKPMSSTIKPSAYSTVEMLAAYVNQFIKTTVKVAAYTADTGSKSLDDGLSQEQSQRLVHLLTAYGIDARLLYAEGYGSAHLVLPNSAGWDSDNYRIEITLEKLYA